MLINFTIRNYKSIANTVAFTITADKDKSHENNLIKVNKERVSKVHLIYGANGSGKSTLIDAIKFIKDFAIASNTLIESETINVIPFKFKEAPYQELSEFSLTFIKNGIKYFYSFSCTFEKVINERLDVYNSSRPSNIFTRTNTDEYKFNRDVRELNKIKEKNTKNKLFLITAATWNYEKVISAADFVLNDLIFIDSWINNLDNLIKNSDLEEYKTFCLDFLNKIDINIDDFIIDHELNVKTIHKVDEQTYYLNLSEESSGTQQLFSIATALFCALRNEKTIFIDDIDKNLHPLVTEWLIKNFLDEETNIKNSQLIATTHDTNLLNIDLIRRDEIYFIEKDYQSKETSLFSLKDFPPRKDEDIAKAYLLGRYGAIPFIK